MEQRKPGKASVSCDGAAPAAVGSRTHASRRLARAARSILLLLPLAAAPLCPAFAADAHAAGHMLPGAVSVGDEELRNVWAYGFPDRLFDGRSLFFANGLAVEMLGTTGWLLNALPGLVDGDASFRDVRLAVPDLSILTDGSGAGLVRLSTYIGEVDVGKLRTGSGHSYGSVRIRDIDLRGTLVRVRRIP